MSKKDKAAKAEKRPGSEEKQPSARTRGAHGKEKSSERPVKAMKAKSLPLAARLEESVKSDKMRMGGREVMLISKALADPTRMSVLRSVAKGNVKCGQILDDLRISPATLSHHMKELEIAALIQTGRDGRFLTASLQRKVWKGYLGELKSFMD